MKTPAIWLMVLTSYCAQSQILFSESFNVILDTAQRVKGSVFPELKIQTQKELLVEFTNTADISMRIGNSYLTLANKIETGSFGKDVFLTRVSGSSIAAAQACSRASAPSMNMKSGTTAVCPMNDCPATRCRLTP
ncbi:hypothetical protein QQ054_25040 [Oscillatoria amoena NRMC-F 0135]|nr:hypothetical protein [Oscillatoria amoena NRMC-F 0135]